MIAIVWLYINLEIKWTAFYGAKDKSFIYLVQARGQAKKGLSPVQWRTKLINYLIIKQKILNFSK